MRALRKAFDGIRLDALSRLGAGCRTPIAKHVTVSRRPCLPVKAGDGSHLLPLVPGHPVRHAVERGRIAAAPHVFRKLLKRRCQAFAEHPHSSSFPKVAGFDANQPSERGFPIARISFPGAGNDFRG